MAGPAIEQRARSAKRQPTGAVFTQARVGGDRVLHRSRMEVGAGGDEDSAVERGGSA